MKIVKSNLILKKNNNSWSLNLPDKARVIEEIVEQWVKSENTVELDLSMEIKSRFQFKTSSQLGYLHAEIWQKWYKYYKEHGYATENEIIKEKIRNDVKMTDDVAFYDRTVNDINNDKIYKVPKSFRNASKEETSVIIERIIRLGNEMGIYFESPEDYLKRKNIKNFTK